MSSFDISLDDVVEKIVEKTGKNKTDVLKLIENKTKEFKGLIGQDAASLIVAKEEEVDISSIVKPIQIREMLTVSELFEGMRSVNIIVRVLHTFPLKEFKKKDGSNGKMTKIVLADSTGVISACLWNQHAQFGQELTKGDVLQIKGGYIQIDKRMQLMLNAGNSTVLEANPIGKLPGEISAPEIKISMLLSKEIPYFSFNAKVMKILTFKKTEDSSFVSMIVADDTGAAVLRIYNSTEEIKEKDYIKIPVAYRRSNKEDDKKIIIVSLTTGIEKVKMPSDFKPAMTEVENLQKQQGYNRKDIIDIKEGEYIEIRGTIVEIFQPKKFENSDNDQNIVISGYLDDGTDVIMGVFFSMKAATLLSQQLEWLFNADTEKIEKVINSVKGKEVIIKGKVQLNNFSKKIEIIVANVEKADPVVELKKLVDTSLSTSFK